MKKKFLLFTASASMAAMVLSGYSSGPAASGQGNRTTIGCGGGGCHGANSTAVSVTISVLNGSTPVTGYTPGQSYTIRLTGGNSAGSHPNYGFQLSAVKASGSTQAGSFSATGTTGVSVRTGIGGLDIVEQNRTLSGTTGAANVYDISFNWTAPAAGTGVVNFKAVLNSVNGNGSADAGDVYNFGTLQLAEATTGIGNMANNIALSAYPSPVKDVLHITMSGAVTKNNMIAVYDLAGRRLQQTAVSNQEAVMDVSALPAGHYIAIVTNENGRGVISFLK